MSPDSLSTAIWLGSILASLKIDETLISKFATLEFTDAAQNLVLVGGTGTGKTHLMWRVCPMNHYGPQHSVSLAFSIMANEYVSSPR